MLCYADVEDYHGGLRAAEHAFQHIPSALQKPLWQWCVVFMSKFGRSVLDGMQKMTENDPLLQARV